jgi:hypothetical protein
VEAETWKCEIALLYEDRTWDTEIVDIPLSVSGFGDHINHFAIQEWWITNHARKGTVGVMVFDPDPEAAW